MENKRTIYVREHEDTIQCSIDKDFIVGVHTMNKKNEDGTTNLFGCIQSLVSAKKLVNFDIKSTDGFNILQKLKRFFK